MKVIWSEGAIADLDKIESYYREQSPRAADRIWVRIVERINSQAEMPYAAPFCGDGPWRRLVVTRTPYVVFYDVVGDELRIEAIFHTSQDILG